VIYVFRGVQQEIHGQSGAETNWHAYERRKGAWKAAHPSATPEEYERAALSEFTETELASSSCQAP